MIVAGGSGSRMGGGIPKQFRSLCGRPVLWWSMKAFHDENPKTRIILVLPKEFITLWQDFYSSLPEEEQYEFKAVEGGKSRFESVRNGLDEIKISENVLIAVHDGARPLVSGNIISKGWEFAEKNGAAIPVIPVVDSLREITSEGSFSVDRSKFMAVQTPQVFKASVLQDAYNKAGKEIFTDDASVVENAGQKISLFEGSADNIKITNPKDMAIAGLLMGKNG